MDYNVKSEQSSFNHEMTSRKEESSSFMSSNTTVYPCLENISHMRPHKGEYYGHPWIFGLTAIGGYCGVV